MNPFSRAPGSTAEADEHVVGIGERGTKSTSSNRFHEPLHPLDSEVQTVGCRHTNPSACAKNSLQGICAFVRHDGLCLSPRRSWPKQFHKLKLLGEVD
jgi:hypothetical protein